MCVCVCVWDAFCFNELLFGRVATRGESVAQLTPDPAMLHKTQLTTPHQGHVCVPLAPRVSFLLLIQQRQMMQLAADIFRFLRVYKCCHSVWQCGQCLLYCTSLSLLMPVLPVRSNCRGNFTHIQGVILDPPPRPVSIHPSLPPSQPIPCFCFTPSPSELPPPASSWL